MGSFQLKTSTKLFLLRFYLCEIGLNLYDKRILGIHKEMGSVQGFLRNVLSYKGQVSWSYQGQREAHAPFSFSVPGIISKLNLPFCVLALSVLSLPWAGIDYTCHVLLFRAIQEFLIEYIVGTYSLSCCLQKFKIIGILFY